jgi:DNA-directed RNA polymerase specialized sigma24 family protein
MKPEIEKYIIQNYNELKTFCYRLTERSDWSEDLLQDVLLQLYEKEDIKLDKLDTKSIKNYIFKVIITNWHSKTSPFYRKVRRESTLYNELSTLPTEAPQLMASEDIYDVHKLLEIIEIEWTEVSWFHKIIFEKYMVLGSLKKVAIDTTIPLTSIARYVKETKQQIKQNTIIKYNE